MTKRSFAQAVVWAIGTFTLALAGGLPSRSGADGPGPMPVAIGKANLQVNGLDLSVDVGGAATRPDGSVLVSAQPLSLRVHVVNPTSQTATAQFTLRLLARRVANPAARTIPTPSDIWHTDSTVAVAGKDADALSFTTAPAPGEGDIMIELAAGGQSIVAWRGTVQPPMTPAEPAAAAIQPSQPDAN